MEIEVTTRSKAKRELIYAVASLYAQNLNIEKSKYKLTIGTVSGLAKADKINGAVVFLGEKTLFMTLDSRLSIEQLIQTMAHEMVHVKQYAKGQLKVVNPLRGDPYFTWMGKKCKKHYFECPWELEAFGRERILANRVAQIISG
jgi:hypothetical protein